MTLNDLDINHGLRRRGFAPSRTSDVTKTEAESRFAAS